MKKFEKNLDKETEELIELSREILRLSRKMRSEKSEKPKQGSAYEEAIKGNPYISNYDISYYQ